MQTISTNETFGSGLTFEDAVTRYLETLGQNLNVTYDDSGEFRIQTEEGGDFKVQVCPRDEYENLLKTDEIFAGAVARLKYDQSRFFHEIEVDGQEYIVIPQT